MTDEFPENEKNKEFENKTQNLEYEITEKEKFHARTDNLHEKLESVNKFSTGTEQLLDEVRSSTNTHLSLTENLQKSQSTLDSLIKSKYSTRFTDVKESMEGAQYKGVKGLLNKVGLYTAKPIQERMVIDNLLTEILNANDKHVEKTESLRDKAENMYKQKAEKYTASRNTHNRFYDVHEDGCRELLSLQEELTTHIAAKDKYINIESQPGYKGEVNDLLKQTHSDIDALETARGSLEKNLRDINTELSVYRSQTITKKSDLQEAEILYSKAADMALQVRIENDNFKTVLDIREGKEGIYKVFADLHDESKEFGALYDIAETQKTMGFAILENTDNETFIRKKMSEPSAKLIQKEAERLDMKKAAGAIESRAIRYM